MIAAVRRHAAHAAVAVVGFGLVAVCTTSVPARASAAPAVVMPATARIVTVARREMADPVRSREHRGSDNCTYYNGVEAPLYPTCGFGTDGVAWRGGTGRDDDEYAWCANFAKYVWSRAGGVLGVDELDTWAVSFRAYGLRHRTWHARTSGYVPRPGDALVMDRHRDGVVDHVGIVVSVSGGTLTMISGNSTGNRIATSVYRDYSHRADIVGYAGPVTR
jgi:hypothetical protein